jgi:ABC-type lipoprotein export system ATPase subunit
MPEPKPPSWDKGAQWHRWDPHLHAPGTILNDQFKGDWDGYVKAIESASPAAEALGITDYCVLNSYREFRKRWKAGRMPGVKFIFPNIEFRLSIETEKKRGINVHLLFSPEDADHEAQIERVLSTLHFPYQGQKYRCIPADLIALGRKCDVLATTDAAALAQGVNSFKLTFSELQETLGSDKWAQQNCLVAVAAAEGDGTAGLQKDASFKAQRQEIEAESHIIFSGKPGDREYWLGLKPGYNKEELERVYGSLKPCLHGSDAHELSKVLNPDEQRYCWIRAELSLMGLRQTLLEPEQRVCIGPLPPPSPSPSERIDKVVIMDAPWLKTTELTLNDGLIAVIGPKGSGKTALADIVAHAAGAEIQDEASFLLKAKDFLGNAQATLSWHDGSTKGKRLTDLEQGFEAELGIPPAVRYLSQQVVDRLCASDSLGRELLDVIEDVVFRSIQDDEKRLGATSFEELRETRLEPVKALREQHLAEINQFTTSIAHEDEKKAKLPAKSAKHKEHLSEVKKSEDELAALVPKAKEKEAAELAAVQAAVEAKNRELQGVALQSSKLDELAEKLTYLDESTVRQFEAFKGQYQFCGLTEADWAALRPVFPSNLAGTLNKARERLKLARAKIETGLPTALRTSTLATWSLADLRAKVKTLTEFIGIEEQRAKKHREVSARLVVQRRERDKLQVEIDDANQADARRKIAVEGRRKVYAKHFGLFTREQDVLNDLYAPLKENLAKDAAQRRLEFYVARHIDLDAWVDDGEQLLDLRRAGAFQGKGKLKQAVVDFLLPAWRSGSAAEVSEAMQKFIETHAAGLMASRADNVSPQDVGRWLFSTGHISLEYGIKYDGVELSRLSPGMRGIVLLILYLAVDIWDTRPLVVDQPEENLDPQSVYEELVGYFRQAKRRRQVILVTHNPNLVVNADADQVIVASSLRTSPGALPTISYVSGGLEDKSIRKQVCRILEGGERAFLERERRYALPRSLRGARTPGEEG